MALDGDVATEAEVRPGSLQGALSMALASVADVCGRLGLVEAKREPADEEPDREIWASISSDVCASTENAAIAAGLHHQAAAELDDIAREMASIRSLIRAP